MKRSRIEESSVNGYDLVAKCLKAEGTEWIACFPDNPLIEASARIGIRPIVFRQERGAINAADGYSRQSAGKKVGVFVSQSGPGVENSFGGIAQAWGYAVPLLFLPGGSGVGRYDVQPNFSAVKNYEHVSKLAISIDQPGRTAREMRRAFHTLKQGRPGPVVVEMHGDVLGSNIEEAENVYSVPQAILTQPNSNDIKDAIRLLNEARNPVLWVGQGVLYADACQQLMDFVNLAQVPVITTMQAKSAFPDDHALALGSANRTAPKTVFEWLGSADLVFAIGSALTRTGFGLQIPEGKRIVQSTNNAMDINKDYDIELGLVGDAKLTLHCLIDEFKAQVGDNGRPHNESLTEAIRASKRSWLNDWDHKLNSTETPINPYRVINAINNVIDHQRSVVTHDAGNPRDQIMPFYRASKPFGYIGWGKTTHLGYGLPLAIGAKLADPEKFCMNFMGDLAFGHTGTEIETAVRAEVPITTVIVNNGTMGGYDKKLKVAMSKYGVGNQTGEYAAMSRALGATGIVVNRPEEIEPALQSAQRENSEGRTVVVEVITRQDTDFSQYPAHLHSAA
ncbi:MAG: thiamine pyrophosphate-requiring protein [Gammaproteobacteria bacterium]|nr:thiamine pyrophosphate-requiring protein [Gammaproteobacteria bacterium]